MTEHGDREPVAANEHVFSAGPDSPPGAETFLVTTRELMLEGLLRELVEGQAINMYGPREEWAITGAEFADLYERVQEALRD